jgi:putative ABC transport system permease protein
MPLHLSLPSSTALLVGTALAALLALLAVVARAPYLVRIAARNTRRRPLRSLLIVAGLMLATTFISAALVLDDTIVLAVKQVAVYSLGRVDEEVVSRSSGLGLYPAGDALLVEATLAHDRRVAGVAPALAVPDLLVVDENTRQVRGNVLGIGLDDTEAGPLGQFTAPNGLVAPPIREMGPGELDLNRSAARLLAASPGDTLDVYSSYAPGQRYRFTVRTVVTGGAASQLPSALAPLATLQRLLAAPGKVNRVYIANAGDGLSGVGYSNGIAKMVDTYAPAGLHTRKVKQEGVNYALGAEQLFGRILALYTLFALAIGVLLIFLIFALLAAERRAELATLRAIGLHRIGVIRLLLLEGAAYGLPASLLGAGLGAALGAVIIRLVAPTVAQFGLPLHLDIESDRLLAALCLGMLVTLGAILIAVWAASGGSVAPALRGVPEPPRLRPSLAQLAHAALPWPLARRAPASANGMSAIAAAPAPQDAREARHAGLPAQAASAARRQHAPHSIWSGVGMLMRAWLRLVWGLVLRGPLPLLVSLGALQIALSTSDALAVEGALSGLLISVVLVLRWAGVSIGSRLLARRKPSGAVRASNRLRDGADRLSALGIGLALVVQWSLPLDTFEHLGSPPLTGGVAFFFVSSMMAVAGAVFALAPNLDLLLRPLRFASRAGRRPRFVSSVALMYPAQQRLRSGLTVAMFSLVTCTMVVMACVAASTTQRFGNYSAQSGGYDIIGQPLFSSPGTIPEMTGAIRATQPGAASDLAGVAEASPLPLMMLQPGIPNTRWAVYPAASISGTFLQGAGLPLIARAPQFASDAAVWDAVRTQPGDVVVDAGALSGADLARLGITAPARVGVQDFVAPPIASGLLGLAALESLLGQSAALEAERAVPPDVRQIISDPKSLSAYALHLRDIALGAGRIAPTQLWLADPRGGAPSQVTVVGIVDNSHSQSYGLLGAPATFAAMEQGLTHFAGDYYFFKLRPGAPVHNDALAIGSALLHNGFQTTVISDALIDQNAPQVFASRVLIGLVGLALIAGMIALAVTGTRAVVERRQQIGTLRALGFRRRAIGSLFVDEALVIAVIGAALGLALGLALARNLVAVSFFAPVPAGLPLVVPVAALAGVCLLALVVAGLAALAPAAQAARVAPAEALRYE